MQSNATEAPKALPAASAVHVHPTRSAAALFGCTCSFRCTRSSVGQLQPGVCTLHAFGNVETEVKIKPQTPLRCTDSQLGCTYTPTSINKQQKQEKTKDLKQVLNSRRLGRCPGAPLGRLWGPLGGPPGTPWGP